MFAIKSKKSIGMHVFLITAVLLNGFQSSLMVAQARQESAPLTSPNLQETEQEANSNPQAELRDSAIDAENRQTTNIGINPSIAFVENVGQFDPRARFQTQIEKATVHFMSLCHSKIKSRVLVVTILSNIFALQQLTKIMFYALLIVAIFLPS